jgi:Flp pilus assembly protein TadD
MLAQALVANKEADKAQAVLDDWVRLHPKDELALRALAEVQLLAGNAAGARKSYEQIIAIEPDNPGSQAGYALLLLRLNDPAAKAAAEKAYKLAPANPELADLYGWIMVLQGQPEAGTTLLREARLRDPANGALRFHLAFALNKAGKKAEAKEELGAALAGTTTLALNPEVKKLKSELGI